MALKPGGPPLPGDGSGDRHMPGGRRPLGPANGGVTEDWGKVILRIKEDLKEKLHKTLYNAKIQQKYDVRSSNQGKSMARTAKIRR